MSAFLDAYVSAAESITLLPIIKTAVGAEPAVACSRDASVCAAMKEEAAEGRMCEGHSVPWPRFTPLRFFVVTQVRAQL
jgi:hypothetical protein